MSRRVGYTDNVVRVSGASEAVHETLCVAEFVHGICDREAAGMDVATLAIVLEASCADRGARGSRV